MSSYLTHWGRVTHICVSKLTIIGSDNGLSPGRRQAIIWTNAGILLIRPLGTNFSEILGEIHSFSFPEMHLKISSAKWRLFGLGLNELTPWSYQLIPFVITIIHFLWGYFQSHCFSWSPRGVFGKLKWSYKVLLKWMEWVCQKNLSSVQRMRNCSALERMRFQNLLLMQDVDPQWLTQYMRFGALV